MEPKAPSSIDQLVGRRVLARRLELNMSQDVLGAKLGVTFQQVQKYEGGKNRITAGRLYELARALDTTISAFFDGADELGALRPGGLAEEGMAFFPAPPAQQVDRDTVDLLIALKDIEDPRARKSLVTSLIKQARSPREPRK